MSTKNKIEDALGAFMAELSGASGYFERQAYGMQVMLQCLDMTRAYVYGEGPRPYVQAASPVEELPPEPPQQPVQRQMSPSGYQRPPNGNYPAHAYPEGIQDPFPDLPNVIDTMRRSGAIRTEDEGKSHLADMIARKGGPR